MHTAIHIATILVSVVLTLVILMQTKGSSFSGAFGGDTSSIYKTRRGFEKTLYEATIVIAVIFVLLALITAIVI